MSFGFPDPTDPTYKEFQRGWNLWVQGPERRTDVYWDPVDGRWETYSVAKKIMTVTSLPRVVLVEGAFASWRNQYLYPEVKKIGAIIKQVAPRTVWNPRDGYWYSWQDRTEKPPPPPPPPPRPPDWVERLNDDLDALDSADMSPAERASARRTIIEGYSKERDL